MKKYLKFAILFLFGFLGGLTGSLVVSLFQTSSSPITETSSSSEKVTVSNVNYDNETSVTEAVSTVQDAVVSVIGYEQNAGNIDSLFGGQNASGDLTVSSEGSGVIYKKEGDYAYLVTNTHVIAGAQQIDIQLSSGEKVEGELVGSDTYSDIAVIKIDASKVTTVAEFADSDTIKVGETAIAIGSPLGAVYANSVTKGIVSSLSRTVTTQSEDGQIISTNAIQTDTAINPGNSGGPLINIQGQVIGITSSKITFVDASSNVSVEGMGFAIPSNDAIAIINQLEESGKVIRPALGVQMIDLAQLSSSQLQTAGLEDSDLTSGVLIISTQTGLPADGKLERYDVITAIDGETIETTSDLQSALYKYNIGDSIKVTYYRDGQEKTVTIELTHSTDDLSSE